MTLTLTSPYSAAGLTLPNRIVMPPLVIWRSDKTGAVTEEHEAHYEMCGGPGLMIVEATCVSPEGRLSSAQLGIWNDEHAHGLSKLAHIIHRSGAMAGIQIHHAGGKSTLRTTYGEAPLVVSLTGKSPEGAHELTPEAIDRVLSAFAAATERAIAAGFDYVELHGAHGYLMSQFLSPLFNRRRDKWGGSLSNRMRFTIEAYRRCRDVAAGRTEVGIRLGLADGKEGGVDPADGLALARELTAQGCQILHVSNAGGIPEDIVPEGSPFSATLHLAGLVKSDIPAVVIGVGKITTPGQAEAALDAGLADLIAVGRGLLADPGWAEKTVEGRESDIERCMDCKPRCHHFREPEKCPARKKIERAGGPPAPTPLPEPPF